MHYVVLATDYDGTSAEDGIVADATLAALARLRHAAHRLVLVTGRELDDLIRVMPQLDLFSLVVAENGALLYWPETQTERPLVNPPDQGCRLMRQTVERRYTLAG
jgi:HAD superfamily hydrolase (TIGR01484 family)